MTEYDAPTPPHTDNLTTQADTPCPCICHPQPGVPDVHEGEKCYCELTPEEKVEVRKNRLDMLTEIRTEFQEAASKFEKEIFDIYENAGVKITSFIPGCPFVVAGVLNGCGFYVRERSDMWRLVVEEQPWEGADLWNDITLDGETIAAGYFTQKSYQEFSEEILMKLKEHISQEQCHHTTGNRFCPKCGKKLLP